jgi:hypothetical protein
VRSRLFVFGLIAEHNRIPYVDAGHKAPGAERYGTMIRFGFRFIGFWFLAAALVAFVIDGTKSIADSQLVTTSVAEYILKVSPTTLQRLEFGVQNNLGAPWLWDLVFVNVLGWPAFVVLAGIGLLFMLIGRRRRRRDLEEFSEAT